MTDLFSGESRVVVGSQRIQFWIDEVRTDEYAFRIVGWIYLAGVNSWELETKLDFVGEKYNFSSRPVVVHRPDVHQDHAKGKVNYHESGFVIDVPRQNIGPDGYDVIFSLKLRKTGEILVRYPFLSIRVN